MSKLLGSVHKDISLDPDILLRRKRGSDTLG